MPIAAIMFALDVALVLHAAKTGRFSPWGYIILFLPGVGGLAYLLIELVPELLGSYRGQKARQSIGRTLDPDKRYRQLRDNLDTVDTIANRVALANECLDRERFDEALTLFDGVVELPLGKEPQFHVGQARALIGLGRPADAVATLETVRQTWPDYENADAHLLYARALESADRAEEALHEYAAVGDYFPGAEPRVLQARLLTRLGRGAEARVVAEDVVRSLQRAPKHVLRSQVQWLAEARRMTKA